MNRVVLGTACGTGIVLAGIVGYAAAFRGRSLAPEWTLATYSGTVSVSLNGGSWQPAEVKARLASRDRVRTGEDGEVTLVHDASHVTIRASTELQVADLNAETSRFSIAAGTIYVETRGDHVDVRTVSGADVDAVDAGVGLSVKEDGFVSVQVKRGGADFTAMGRTEHVAAGQQSSARAGRPPTTPVQIPDVLLLNVKFPDAETFNARLARVEGMADPGTRVRVGEHDVPVDEAGRFGADIVMKEGLNQLEVTATDALGRTRTELSHPIDVDVTPPGLRDATIGSRRVSPDASASARRTTR